MAGKAHGQRGLPGPAVRRPARGLPWTAVRPHPWWAARRRCAPPGGPGVRAPACLMCRCSSATGNMAEILPHAPRTVWNKNNDLRADVVDAVGSSYGVFTGVREDSYVRSPACDPGGGPDQVVRGRARAAGHRPVGPARDGARPARSQRGGQDDRGADPDHAAAPGRGPRRGRRLRRGPGGRGGPPVDRAGRAVGRHPGGADRPGEPGDSSGGCTTYRGRRRAAGPSSCWSSSA
jgi:hypothetical protein